MSPFPVFLVDDSKEFSIDSSEDNRSVSALIILCMFVRVCVQTITSRIGKNSVSQSSFDIWTRGLFFTNVFSPRELSRDELVGRFNWPRRMQSCTDYKLVRSSSIDHPLRWTRVLMSYTPDPPTIRRLTNNGQRVLHSCFYHSSVNLCMSR